jgi:hypothetical protein
MKLKSYAKMLGAIISTVLIMGSSAALTVVQMGGV